VVDGWTIDVLFVCLALVAFVLVGIGVVMTEKMKTWGGKGRRRKNLAAFAQRNGLEFHCTSARERLAGWAPESRQSGLLGDTIRMFEGFLPRIESYPTADNLCMGSAGPFKFYSFDYRYRQDSSHDKELEIRVTAMLAPMCCSYVQLRPGHRIDSIGGACGTERIEFESAEFNRLYYVEATDRKFAYDLIDPGMIEYLLLVQPRHWQLRGEHLVVISEAGDEYGDDLESILIDMRGFIERIPSYLFAGMGFR
jgi:hypothetical protein